MSFNYLANLCNPELTQRRHSELTQRRHPELTQCRHSELKQCRHSELKQYRHPERTQYRHPERTQRRHPERSRRISQIVLRTWRSFGFAQDGYRSLNSLVENSLVEFSKLSLLGELSFSK